MNLIKKSLLGISTALFLCGMPLVKADKAEVLRDLCTALTLPYGVELFPSVYRCLSGFFFSTIINKFLKNTEDNLKILQESIGLIAIPMDEIHEGKDCNVFYELMYLLIYSIKIILDYSSTCEINSEDFEEILKIFRRIDSDDYKVRELKNKELYNRYIDLKVYMCVRCGLLDYKKAEDFEQSDVFESIVAHYAAACGYPYEVNNPYRYYFRKLITCDPVKFISGIAYRDWSTECDLDLKNVLCRIEFRNRPPKMENLGIPRPKTPLVGGSDLGIAPYVESDDEWFQGEESSKTPLEAIIEYSIKYENLFPREEVEVQDSQTPSTDESESASSKRKKTKTRRKPSRRQRREEQNLQTPQPGESSGALHEEENMGVPSSKRRELVDSYIPLSQRRRRPNLQTPQPDESNRTLHEEENMGASRPIERKLDGSHTPPSQRGEEQNLQTSQPDESNGALHE